MSEKSNQGKRSDSNAPVCSLTPESLGKVSSARLNCENYLHIHPVCAEMDGSYTELGEGIVLKGWSSPPWPSASPKSPDAIVYEKTEQNEDDYEFIPFGLCWVHGDARKMKFNRANAYSPADGAQNQ